MPNQYTYKTLEEQIQAFWNRIDKTGGEVSCWLWTAGRDDSGYGNARWGKKTTKAHRVAYLLTYGLFSDDLYVLHKCDNPPCCNPRHLFLGTHLENMEDRDQKGRNKNYCGEKHPMAKLSDNQISEIRLMYSKGNITQKRIGEIYGITENAISRIVTYKAWKKDSSGEQLPKIDSPDKKRKKAVRNRHLTEQEILNIRNIYAGKSMTQKEISELFGISSGYTCRIVNQKARI